MNISWYKVEYSRFDRPMIALIYSNGSDVESVAEGWLFHPDDGNTPHKTLHLRHAAGHQDWILQLAVISSFEDSGNSLAKACPFPVDTVDVRIWANNEVSIRAARTLGLYESMGYAGRNTRYEEVRQKLAAVAGLTND